MLEKVYLNLNQKNFCDLSRNGLGLTEAVLLQHIAALSQLEGFKYHSVKHSLLDGTDGVFFWVDYSFIINHLPCLFTQSSETAKLQAAQKMFKALQTIGFIYRDAAYNKKSRKHFVIITHAGWGYLSHILNAQIIRPSIAEDAPKSSDTGSASAAQRQPLTTDDVVRPYIKSDLNDRPSEKQNADGINFEYKTNIELYKNNIQTKECEYKNNIENNDLNINFIEKYIKNISIKDTYYYYTNNKYNTNEKSFVLNYDFEIPKEIQRRGVIEKTSNNFKIEKAKRQKEAIKEMINDLPSDYIKQLAKVFDGVLFDAAGQEFTWAINSEINFRSIKLLALILAKRLSETQTSDKHSFLYLKQSFLKYLTSCYALLKHNANFHKGSINFTPQMAYSKFNAVLQFNTNINDAASMPKTPAKDQKTAQRDNEILSVFLNAE